MSELKILMGFGIYFYLIIFVGGLTFPFRSARCYIRFLLVNMKDS